MLHGADPPELSDGDSQKALSNDTEGREKPPPEQVRFLLPSSKVRRSHGSQAAV